MWKTEPLVLTPEERSELERRVRARTTPHNGKTHISVALGLEAIAGGFSCYFTTLSKIANDLSSSYSPTKMRKYTSPKVLIIDEMGYRPLDRMAANYFFDIISARYETGTVILSSNKGFSEWGDLFSDPILASVLLVQF